MREKAMKGKAPLEGIKAIDLGWIGVEPVTMRYLADWGATVIRVESHKAVDTLRVGRPFKDNIAGVDRSAWFAQYNASKLGMTLDLSNPESKKVVVRLLKWTDIISSSFRGEALKKWGLDYDSVRKMKPNIIYFETGMLGHWGPNAAFRGYGGEATSLAGFVYPTGWPDRDPVPPAYAYSDFVNPPIGVAAIMAAMDYCRRTGKGVHLEQSQQECTIPLQVAALLDYSVNGRIAERNGNRDPLGAPHGAYACTGEDRWCTIAVFTEEEWKAFVRAIGSPAWAKQSKFATLADRKRNEDELDALVSAWTKSKSREEVVSILQSAGVAAGAVQDAKDLFEDPELKHRQHFQARKHGGIGVHNYDTFAFRLSKTPFQISAGPCLGQHNEYVYKELLGFSDEEIAEFITKGVITTEKDLPQVKAVV